MEVVEQVNRTTSRTDAEQEQVGAEARLAMALTRVFDYMVAYGVAEDVGDASCEDWAEKTDVHGRGPAQQLCMLSLQSDTLQGAVLDAALGSAKAALTTWPQPYEGAGQFSSVEETGSSQAASSSPLERADPDLVSHESPIGRKVALRSRTTCRARASPRQDDKSEDEDEPEDGLLPPRTRPVEKRKGGPSHSSSDSRSEEEETRQSAPTGQYCSQACLLGLKRGWALDDGCPNVLAHRVAAGGSPRHPITAEFTRLVSQQLRDNPYRGCLGLGGLVGKGTLADGLERLRHECQVYARLATLEGRVVPVHPGQVHLDRGYVLLGAMRVVHMMLMSWGGERAAKAGTEAAELEVQRRRSSEVVWAAVVNHWDVCDANLLWNVERRRVMVIDFDQQSSGRRPNTSRYLR
ncbi:hypothetical protein JX266_014235 [Neoarthrinium moseri]|nr:hypothetical protein JX266_014235 [Neoarthrinium moseri]